MYAVIKSGGKQYQVSEGQVIKLEKINTEPGKKVEFDEVLLIANGDKITVGQPFVKGGKVKASVVEHGRLDKIHILKFKRRKHHMKQMGHRQYYTAVKIEKIVE